MKRLLILLAGCLLMVSGMQAQNANRSGFFIELQGGSAIGTVMDYPTWGGYDGGPYIKGGFVGGLDLGYRFATSRAFAFEVKVDAWSNFLDFRRSICMHLMPGIRWTSKEIGSNISLFIALNAGYGMSLLDLGSPSISIEIGVGCNLTNQISLGLFIRGLINEWADLDDREPKSYASVGLKLGYRF